MKLKSIISAFVLGIIAMGCTDLEEENFSFVPTSEYGKTADEIKTIAGSAYASLRGGRDGASLYYPASEYVFFLVESVSDEVCVPTRGADWDDNGRYQEAQVHDLSPDNAMVLSAWKYCYKGISTCNFVLSTIESGGLPEEEEKAATAEIRGVRAYYYYLLLSWFGNVPLSTTFPETESPSTSPRAVVYAFVESELLDIRDYLQEDIEYGRFTQNVCNTLLARLYINSDAFIGTPRWQDCLDACDLVSGYTLTANTLDNFVTENQYSTEIIWSVPYDRVEGTTGNYLASLTFHYNHWQTISSSQSNWTWSVNGICAQPGVFSSFEEGDERVASMCEGRQLRPNGVPVLDRNGDELVYTENITDFYNAGEGEGCRLQKYEVIFGEYPERDYDLVLMRYAEILMMKAECYVRLNNPSAALPLVQQIRERSGLTSTPDPITLEVLDEEYLHEFLFEGMRRDVNIRFGSYFEPSWANPNITPKNKAIFPIPESELEINSNLTQNPGY
ncbi:MAG: RagB/SusD family nutrient uptake outer membrane protein [Bacteroidales bacterium]|nr:RagB/SusD family nutrient uptake outer membrane protein [Bacteroidales bacterium]